MKAIYAFIRSVIEEKANRYFIIEEPIELEIKDLPKIETEMPLHPNFPKKGIRKFTSTNY